MTRLIPAHAGKTRRHARTHAAHEAHPRSRGENGPDAPLGVLRAGSSPLTRGKPGQATDPRDRRGLIPAHAGKTSRHGWCCAPPAAHPRSRGENRTEVLLDRSRPGSSPLTRGKLLTGPTRAGKDGLIPAHAGKTNKAFSTGMRSSAHPRSRGENYWRRFGEVSAMGSSPLTRGKLIDRATVTRPTGLIPAHAGKTSGYIRL